MIFTRAFFDLLKELVSQMVLAVVIPSARFIHLASDSDVIGQLHDRRRCEK